MTRLWVDYRPKKPLIDAYVKEHGVDALYDLFVESEEHGGERGITLDCPPDLREEIIRYFFKGRDIFADNPELGSTAQDRTSEQGR